ncbi:dynein light chain binding protein [Aureococcus anophagefferens]|nr:dynein light chain binding protein [Aureococcus anophagefferens]
MLKQEEDYKIKLAGLETDLLEALATAEGDLLENALLIESLTRTKEASREISTRAASAEASATLDARREAYRGFSRDGSRLYFLVRDLVLVNPMYQVSLASFVRLFEAALRDGSADRCMFALHVVHGMHAEHFLDHEWELFTGELAADGAGDAPPDAAGGRRGRGDGDGDGAGRRPRASGVGGPRPRARVREHGRALGGLVRRLDLENAARWSRWARSPECERDFPPEAVRECTPFQRVLVTRCFRPDRLMSALSAFACEVLRVPSLSPPPLSFATLYETETEARTPTLLITTAGADPSRGAARAEGADPSKELADFAASVVGADRYTSLAMGGGTHDLAMSLLADASAAGTWLCFQNLHLVVAWLPALEKALAGVEQRCAFRVLLQQALKVTFESPPGTKKNVFHAILQERRTYIPQGWTKSYEFSVGDLRAGAFVMGADPRKGGSDEALASRLRRATAAAAGDGAAPLDLDVVHGLMEDAIYGGRVDNPYDARVLKAYLRKIFNQDVFDGRGDLMRGLSIPRPCAYDDALAAVAALPDGDAPALFGLPDNIERSVQRTQSAHAADQLRARGGAKATEAPAGAVDPIAGFVAMERAIAAAITAEVAATLDALRKVVYGTALLTPHIQAVVARAEQTCRLL